MAREGARPLSCGKCAYTAPNETYLKAHQIVVHVKSRVKIEVKDGRYRIWVTNRCRQSTTANRLLAKLSKQCYIF